MAEVRGIRELEAYLPSVNTFTGCMVDTNILFALSYPLDTFNEDAITAFENLAKNSIPIFTNVNIRSELVELHRRVAIPEALIDFLEDTELRLNKPLYNKLRSIRTSYRSAQKENRTFKLNDKKIKDIRELFISTSSGQKDGWEQFCKDYLSGSIQGAWDDTVNEWNLNFFSLRSTEDHPLIQSEVSWDDMVKLVEQFGIGSMDAMILNLFRASKLDILLTADSDLAYCANKLKLPGKTVFVPDSLNKE